MTYKMASPLHWLWRSIYYIVDICIYSVQIASRETKAQTNSLFSLEFDI